MNHPPPPLSMVDQRHPAAGAGSTAVMWSHLLPGSQKGGIITQHHCSDHLPNNHKFLFFRVPNQVCVAGADTGAESFLVGVGSGSDSGSGSGS